MKKALILTLCLGLLGAVSASAQNNKTLEKHIELSPQQIKKLTERTKQHGEVMYYLVPSCSLIERTEEAAILGLLNLMQHAQDNALTETDKAIQKKLLAFYQKSSAKNHNIKDTRKEVAEIYALLQQNQEKIPVAANKPQAPGAAFTMLLTQLPESIDFEKLVYRNERYKNQLKKTMQLSPCSEAK